MLLLVGVTALALAACRDAADSKIEDAGGDDATIDGGNDVAVDDACPEVIPTETYTHKCTPGLVCNYPNVCFGGLAVCEASGEWASSSGAGHAGICYEPDHTTGEWCCPIYEQNAAAPCVYACDGGGSKSIYCSPSASPSPLPARDGVWIVSACTQDGGADASGD